MNIILHISIISGIIIIVLVIFAVASINYLNSDASRLEFRDELIVKHINGSVHE